MAGAATSVPTVKEKAIGMDYGKENSASAAMGQANWMGKRYKTQIQIKMQIQNAIYPLWEKGVLNLHFYLNLCLRL